MCKRVTVFKGLKNSDNEAAISALRKLKDVEIEYINDCGILEDIFHLPFIETDEGDRFFGVNSINKFVKSATK